jgi:predicted hydrocarbon binding protein
MPKSAGSERREFFENPLIMNLISQKRPDKDYFELFFQVKNVRGVLANISDAIASSGMNILSGFHSAIKGIEGGWTLFLEVPTSTSVEPLINKVRSISGVCDIKYNKLGKSEFFDCYFFPLTMADSRVVILTGEAFAKIKNQLLSILGTGGESILFLNGMDVGRTIYKSIPQELSSIEEKLSYTSDLLRITGWGVVEFRKIDIGKNVGEIRVENNAEVSDKYPLRCHFIRGIVTSILREAFDKESINLKETRCIGNGGEFCQFELV